VLLVSSVKHTHTHFGSPHHISSSPGFVASIDDFYTLKTTNDQVEDTHLVVIETSNGVYNDAAYDALDPETSPCWIRVMVANMLGTSGSEWSDMFSAYHSGTYNNQWLVIDLNKFEAGIEPTSDVLWVTEEAPGLMHAQDQTATLVSEGYWASYNVAFYPDIRAVLGEQTPYDTATRAKLFREMQGNVTSIETMQWMMGWNDYENDPISKVGSSVIAGGLALNARLGYVHLLVLRLLKLELKITTLPPGQPGQRYHGTQ